jgi:hydroxymethylpyrimidine pyrophosphatase-like HAD family hydrolase
MKLKAIALDYDGTIATDGVFNHSVRAALPAVRQRGVSLVLATGRRLNDLRRVAGNLECFDAIVAENGAVLHFPASGQHIVLGRPPHQAVLDDLERHGVDFTVGETIVETDAGMAVKALETVRRLEQPLVLAFNRSRLMLLPQGISKSTGLRHALNALRLSLHNTIGVGDAENDHDLLDACEVGAAAAWGSRALREVADDIIEGAGPEAVAGYLRRVSSQARLAPAQMGRRRLMLGFTDAGEAVQPAVRGRTIFIAGEPGTGKSWLAGLLCEQLILQGYCMCIIDPEGDYQSLGSLPGVVTLGGDDPPPSVRELTRALQHPDISVFIDLAKLARGEKTEYLRMLLPTLAAFRRRTGLPHKILVDEAHYYLGEPHGGTLFDAELGSYILVTYQISALARAIQNSRDALIFVTRENDPEELATFTRMCECRSPGVSINVEALQDLHANEAALLPGPDNAGDIRRFRVMPRLTTHVRHRVKYLDMGVIDSKAFVFTRDGHEDARAQTLREFIALLSREPESTLDPHLTRHDFSRWLSEVFRDGSVAARVRALEDRIGHEQTREIATDIAQAIRARYDTAAERTTQ